MLLHPKRLNRFRVVFYDEDNKPIAKELSKQILSVHDLPTILEATLIDENDDWLIYELNVGDMAPFMVRAVIADDQTNKAVRDLYDMMDNTNMTMSIQVLDGNDEMIETITLTEVDVVETELKDLDYAESGNQARLVTFTYYNAVNNLKKL